MRPPKQRRTPNNGYSLNIWCGYNHITDDYIIEKLHIYSKGWTTEIAGKENQHCCPMFIPLTVPPRFYKIRWTALEIVLVQQLRAAGFSGFTVLFLSEA